MNLISCHNCGIVLDKDKLWFPPIGDNDYDLIPGNSEYDGEDFISITSCPLCKKPIKENGEQPCQ